MPTALVLTVSIGLNVVHRGRDEEVAHVSRPAASSVVALAGERRTEAAVAIEPVIARPRAAGPAADGTVTSFETLVPDDQRRALDLLVAAMREGRASVPPAVADHELNDSGQRAPRALVIEPMKLELLAGTPGEPVKDPIK